MGDMKCGRNVVTITGSYSPHPHPQKCTSFWLVNVQLQPHYKGGNWQSTPLAEESLTLFLACQTSTLSLIYTQGGFWFMRPIQKPWGVTPGHSQVFSCAWFLAVSHLQEGLLSCHRATLHSSLTLRPVKVTPFCLFCWPVERRVHTGLTEKLQMVIKN